MGHLFAAWRLLATTLRGNLDTATTMPGYGRGWAYRVNAVDYSGYPDCRPEFLEAFEEVARRGTRAGIEGHGVEVRAPLVHLTKAGIIRLGRDLGVDYSLTRTCYDPSPDGAACGHCDACLLRLKGFAELGLTDPAPYRQTVAS